MEFNNFQRIGSNSNTDAGNQFEVAVLRFFEQSGVRLCRNFPAPIGFELKKAHRFDLGSNEPPVLIECKSYTWTSGGNSPSAKIRGMNEAMLHFSLAPAGYRRMLFVQRDAHPRRGITLAQHYVATQGHLIPPGVEVWDFSPDSETGTRVR